MLERPWPGPSGDTTRAVLAQAARDGRHCGARPEVPQLLDGVANRVRRAGCGRRECRLVGTVERPPARRRLNATTGDRQPVWLGERDLRQRVVDARGPSPERKLPDKPLHATLERTRERWSSECGDRCRVAAEPCRLSPRGRDLSDPVRLRSLVDELVRLVERDGDL